MTLEEFKTQSQVFIFNWYRTSENAKELQIQFSGQGIETFVINSHEEEDSNGLPNWVNIGESGYMVQQYAKAKEIFSKTYFIEMFADISDVNAELILEVYLYITNSKRKDTHWISDRHIGCYKLVDGQFLVSSSCCSIS